MMVDATKKQMMEFISTHFVTDNNEYPTISQLDVFKKGELAKMIEYTGHAQDFDNYINSLN